MRRYAAPVLGVRLHPDAAIRPSVTRWRQPDVGRFSGQTKTGRAAKVPRARLFVSRMPMISR
jgi:hypothetical protein